MTRHRRLGGLAGRLYRDRGGAALIEFGFTLPLLLVAGMGGVESANLALVNLRLSQIALNLADDASRVGNTPLTTQQLREVDINDVLQAARYQGASIGLTTHGRIILSSLEMGQESYDSSSVQRIHWQRCLGLMNGAGYDSSYGTATPLATAGTDSTQANSGVLAANGMGDAGAKVNAPPPNSGPVSGVVFVEINYQYQPLVSAFLFGSISRIHYVASFIVRDNRDFSQIYNPGPSSTPSTCDKYTT